MKKGAIIFSLLFIISIFGEAYFYDFNAYNSGTNVIISWKTMQENNLKEFVIERSTPQSSFVDIATIKPKGSNSSYSYTDEAAYKTSDLIFIYRIKIVGTDPSDVSYSITKTVLSKLSGFKQTWGMIKAMFR